MDALIHHLIDRLYLAVDLVLSPQHPGQQQQDQQLDLHPLPMLFVFAAFHNSFYPNNQKQSKTEPQQSNKTQQRKKTQLKCNCTAPNPNIN
jgi:hypothetical protein